MNLENFKKVLLCPHIFTPFYEICPPFQKAPSGNPSLLSLQKRLQNFELYFLKIFILKIKTKTKLI
jgi:hypothetical protein